MAPGFPGYPGPGPGPGPGSLVVAGGLHEEDAPAIRTIEAGANRADIVYKFAEVKYAQLMPRSYSEHSSSKPHGLGLVASTAAAAAAAGMEFDATSDGGGSLELTPDATILAAEECLVLFVKVLSLLSKLTDIAYAWWAATNRTGVSLSAAQAAASAKMNEAVQWIRTTFNEVLEKAETVQSKIVDAQKDLPPNHPSHPSNHPSDVAAGAAAVSNFVLTTGVTAEKLMYDRALEMSRAAALNELVGDDLPGCEAAYATSLNLLEAIVEKREDDEANMDDDDRKLIEKCKLFAFVSVCLMLTWSSP